MILRGKNVGVALSAEVCDWLTELTVSCVSRPDHTEAFTPAASLFTLFHPKLFFSQS